MRDLIMVIVLLCMIGIAESANEVPKPPPLQSEPVSEQKFLRDVSSHLANCPNITASPATRNGKKGDCVLAVYGGNTRLCLNTGDGPNPNTTWLCVTLGAP